MKRILAIVIVLASILVLWLQLRPQAGEGLAEPAIAFAPRHLLCRRCESPVAIDGRDSDAAWKTAEWSDPFVDIAGPGNSSPRWTTHVKLAWDSRYFYILAHLEEPDLWATLSLRDSVIYQDNDFEVFIDPDGDTHGYYELEINAFGTVWDLFLDRPYRDGGHALDAWDINGLRSAVRLEGTINHPGDRDRGWWAELALPWKVLAECAPMKRPPQDGEVWRINFSRVEWRTEARAGKYAKAIDPKTGKPFPEDNWVWSPQGLVNMHYPEMWGYVLFTAADAAADAPEPAAGPEEQAKWFLRRIYYRQRNLFAAKGIFSSQLPELGLEGPALAGFGPVAIHAAPDLFEATLPALDGSRRWSIRQDGLVWKTESKKN